MADVMLESSPDLFDHSAGRYREESLIDVAFPEPFIFAPVCCEMTPLSFREHRKYGVATCEEIETLHPRHVLADRAYASPFEDVQSSAHVSPFQVSLCQMLPKESRGGAHQCIQSSTRVSPFGLHLIQRLVALMRRWHQVDEGPRAFGNQRSP